MDHRSRSREENDARRQLATTMRANGASTAEIARVLYVSTRQALRLAPAKRVRYRRVITEMSQEEIAKAKAMLEERAGYREVARTFNVDEHALARLIPGMALTRQEATSFAGYISRHGGV